MKSIGSSERKLHEGDTVLLDIPCSWRGTPATDKASHSTASWTSIQTA